MPKKDDFSDANAVRTPGKRLRKQTPRSSHGDWSPVSDRPDPIALLQAQDKNRLQHLLPFRYGRMMVSPFAFLCGSAVIMAAELASTPVTGLDTVLCGDAHLANFGIFASPERSVVFDVNDFDETYPGPWEWDLKRLAASAVVAGRGNGFDDKTCRDLAIVVGRAYREAMQRLAAMSIMEVWYYRVNASSVVALFDKYARKSAKKAHKTLRKARSHTSEHTLARITHTVNGKRQFINSPPLLVRLADLVTEEQRKTVKEQGSTVALLEGERPKDALILQQKESGPASLQAYLPDYDFPRQAERVIAGQRLMQASSDIFLGQMHGQSSLQYYWRQFKDMKGSFDVTEYDTKGVATYLAVCGACLARAHARSGQPSAINHQPSLAILARLKHLTMPSATSPSSMRIRCRRTTKRCWTSLSAGGLLRRR